MSSKGGRPSKWTLEIAMRIAHGLGQDKTLDDAARAAGVGASTAWRWVQAGRSGDPRFAELVRMVGANTAERFAPYQSPFPDGLGEFLDRLSVPE